MEQIVLEVYEKECVKYRLLTGLEPLRSLLEPELLENWAV